MVNSSQLLKKKKLKKKKKTHTHTHRISNQTGTDCPLSVYISFGIRGNIHSFQQI